MEKCKGIIGVITNTITKYKEEFENVDFRLETSDKESIVVRFQLEDFLKYSGLGKFNIAEKLKKIKNTEEICNFIALGIVMNLNSIEKNDISSSCSIFLNVEQLTLGVVHSLIDTKDKLYAILKTGTGRPILELTKTSEKMKSGATVYNVTDIKKTNFLKNLIREENATLSFPITSGYRDKDNVFVSYKLSKDYQSDRMLDFKDLLYFDKKGEVRTNESVCGYEEYLKRTPIIK